MERIYDDERAMNIIASALLDSLPSKDPEAFVELVTEMVELTGRDPDGPPPKEA